VQENELVTIDRFLVLSDAAIAKSALDAAGIEAVLTDENVVRLSWGEAAAHGGVRLQVRRSDAPLAIAMLTADEVRSFDIEDNAGDQTPNAESADRCLRCGSEEVFPAESRARTYARGLVFCIGGVMLVNLASCTTGILHVRMPHNVLGVAYIAALLARPRCPHLRTTLPPATGRSRSSRQAARAFRRGTDRPRWSRCTWNGRSPTVGKRISLSTSRRM
jgi:hypothetical protein